MFLGDAKMGAEEKKKDVTIIFGTYDNNAKKKSFPWGKRGTAH